MPKAKLIKIYTKCGNYVWINEKLKDSFIGKGFFLEPIKVKEENCCNE
jgi:hypothetical protein